MNVEHGLKALSFQHRLAVYNNRIVAANWLMVLTGFLTFMRAYIDLASGILFSPGLIAPQILAFRLSPVHEAGLNRTAGAVLAIFLVIIGVMGMLGKMGWMKTGVTVLILDSILLLYTQLDTLKYSAEGSLPVILALTIRVVIIFLMGRGIRAFGKKMRQLDVMEKADRQYDAEQAAKRARYTDTKEVSCTEMKTDAEVDAVYDSDEIQQDSDEMANARFCSDCGAEIDAGDSFCEQCGKKV